MCSAQWNESEEPNTEGGSLAADRVGRVLLEFAYAPAGLGVTEIARSLGLAKSVVHRILRSLVAQGLVAEAADGRRYDLGPAAAAMGVSALTRLDLRQTARPVLFRLRDESQETVTLSAIVGTYRVYIDQVESPQEIKMTVDLARRWPLYAGSTGKVMLAFVDEDLRRHVLERPMPALTSYTVTDPVQLAAELEDIRRRGYACSRGERQQGAASAAAPVLGPHGLVLGAVSVCGPADRFSDSVIDGHGQRAAAAAREIGAGLPGTPAAVPG
jgi:IclR family transcriptional regulator, acetate operon repressor